jgi:4'-phosphopantetheinyl transferase EntD
VPIFFQHQINENTRIGVWKIEETEEFFKGNVPQHRDVTHPHKRLQHLAGRFLLQYLFPDFPFELIQIADTKKPYLPEDIYHFSISHCGDYAAAIVSKKMRVGIDIEIHSEKVDKIKHKFLSEEELSEFTVQPELNVAQEQVAKNMMMTILWSAKESVFKWYGNGAVDFRKHIWLQKKNDKDETIHCFFSKSNAELKIHFRQFERLVLAWVVN